MRRPNTLARLAHADAPDYVTQFQALARVNLEIEQRGPLPARLLRKAMLELDVGNPVAAHEAATDALVLDPDLAEAHYQAALASLMMAFVKVGAVPAGPGHPEPPSEPLVALLRDAEDHLADAVRLRPDDEEATSDLAAVIRLVRGHPGAADLLALLAD